MYYLRTNLKIYLLEKKPQFVPIWPPAIKIEDGYVVNEKKIYGYVVSGNDNPQIYAYNGIQKIPEKINSNNNIVDIKVEDSETLA